MKKILCIIAILGLFGCASNEPVKTQPQTQANTTVYTSSCNTCSTSYTVSKPVEVIYRDITYTTVYEPKTYESVSYSRKPYHCVAGELCK